VAALQVRVLVREPDLRPADHCRRSGNDGQRRIALGSVLGAPRRRRASGIVAELTLAVHSAGELRAAAAVLLLNQAPDGLAAYWDVTDAAPDELFVRAMLMTGPPRRSCPNRYGGQPVLLLAGA
jgi:hypothetical protein